MASIHQHLKARFNVVRRDLDQVLSQLTDDLLPWSPVEGMRSIRGQLFEIVGKEVELLDWAKQGGQGEWNEVDSFGEGESTVEGWKEIFSAARNETLIYLDSLSEEDLNQPISFPTDWWEGMLLPELPLHEVFRNIAGHEWYHTGQLVSYLWLRGSDPTGWKR